LLAPHCDQIRADIVIKLGSVKPGRLTKFYALFIVSNIVSAWK